MHLALVTKLGLLSPLTLKVIQSGIRKAPLRPLKWNIRSSDYSVRSEQFGLPIGYDVGLPLMQPKLTSFNPRVLGEGSRPFIKVNFAICDNSSSTSVQ